VGSEIPKANSDRGCSDSCARPAAANRRRARIRNRVWEGRARPRTPIRLLSTESAREPDCTAAEGDQLTSIAAVVPTSTEEVLGKALLGERISGRQLGYNHRRMIREYIEEQEGEQIADDSRFPIDNP